MTQRRISSVKLVGDPLQKYPEQVITRTMKFFSDRTSGRPNPRLQRTRSALLRSPLSRKPLGAYGKGLGRACGESVELGRRRESFQDSRSFLAPAARPHRLLARWPARVASSLGNRDGIA